MKGPLAAVLLGTMVMGCAALSPRTTPLALSAASAGIAATDAALASYEKLDGLYAEQLQQEKTSNLLVLPKPNYTALVSMSAKEKAQSEARAASIKARVNATRALQETYRAFQRLANGEFGNDTQAAVTQLNTALGAIATAEQLPLSSSVIPAQVGSFAALAINGLKAHDIKRHNLVLGALVRRYRALWDSDLPVWDSIIDATYTSELPPTIVGLPDQDFDVAAVSEMVPQPLSQPLKLRLYRKKLLDDAAAQAAAAKAPLHDVSKALGAIEDAHEELEKDRPTITDVITYIDHAVELSKAAEKDTSNAGPK